MKMQIINEVRDCDGFSHKHAINETGQSFILIEKDGNNVAVLPFPSVEKARNYINLISEMTKDIVNNRVKEPVVTKKTLPVKEVKITPSMSLSPIDESFERMNSLIELSLPKQPKQIIHTPRPQGPSVQSLLNDLKTSLRFIVEDVEGLISHVERIENTLKEGK